MTMVLEGLLVLTLFVWVLLTWPGFLDGREDEVSRDTRGKDDG